MHPSEGPESSVQSGSTLKEHDYIGLAEVSSALHHPSPPPADEDTARDLNLEETDLRLGLGPVKKAEDTNAEKPCSQADKAKLVAVLPDSRQEQQQQLQQQQTRYNAFVDGAAIAAEEQRSGPNVWPSTVQHVKNMCMPAADAGAPPPVLVNGYGNCNRPVAVLKNAMKRGYETMSDARFNVTGIDARSMVNNAGAGAALHAVGEQDSKGLPKHQQGSFLPSWTPPKPSIPGQWYPGLEQPATPFPSTKPPAALPLQKPAAAYKPVETPSDSADVPPSKSRVVGWPPVASYRKQQTLSKPAEMYVKVNMDGITVGRKVDLNAHTTYDSLLLALEEMFQPSNNAQVTGRDNVVNDVKQFRLRNGSEFVLTYEDKEGDWMLVGDVPWSLFVTTVKRLRIVRGSEATGLAPGGLEKVQCPV